MVSPRKLAANGRNATKSTGPRTADGKTRSRLNAASHGLRAVSPVLPGEDPAAWDAYRAGVVADLRAVGTLETELAERVAALSWRLRRVATFEVAAATAPPPPEPRPYLSYSREPTSEEVPPEQVASRLAAAARQLADARRAAELLARLTAGETFAGEDALFLLWQAVEFLPEDEVSPATGYDDDEDDIPLPPSKKPDVESDDFLTALGVPEPHLDTAEGWDGWTAAVVRAGLKRLADSAGWTVERLLMGAAVFVAEDTAEAVRNVERFRGELATATARTAESEGGKQRLKAMPGEATLNAVMRYEPYLAKQLAEALDLLRRVQSERG